MAEQVAASRDHEATKHKLTLEVVLPTALSGERVMAKSAKFTPMMHLVRRSSRSPQCVNVSEKKKSPARTVSPFR
jgi:hypothetical protein